MVRVGVIGAGASGIYCAILLLKYAKKAHIPIEVALIEQNKLIGRKILVSGNGRCNILHDPLFETGFFGADAKVISRILHQFPLKDQWDFLEGLGIMLKKEPDGRIFPYANDAKSVVCILEETLKSLGAIIYLEHEVICIKHDQTCYQLQIKTQENIIDQSYDFVVFATGSIAYPQLGDGQKAMNMLHSLGHSLSLFYPALVPLKSEDIPKIFSGIKMKANIQACIHEGKNKHIFTTRIEGDLLFCDYGISGTAVLDLSPFVSKALLQKKRVDVLMDLLPSMSIDECLFTWKSILQTQPQATVLMLLCACLPKKFAQGILKVQGIPTHTKASMNILTSILKQIKCWRISIVDTKGFLHAEVAGGGILLKNLSPHTLESKKHKRLFVIGEALDITGYRGGYNLSFALCSAFVASLSIWHTIKNARHL